MGRGDKRTAKGKRAKGSHGISRPPGKKPEKTSDAKPKKTAKKA